jgi:hypothetical protein
VSEPQNVPLAAPTFRLAFVADVDGALEPCGCQLHQKGGISHLGAYLATQTDTPIVLFSVGDLLLPAPDAKGEKQLQDERAAHVLAKAFAAMKLSAWVPGGRDARAPDPLRTQLADECGGLRLDPALSSQRVQRSIAGHRVDVIAVGPATTGIADEAKKARAEGAEVIVVLAWVGSQKAYELAKSAPEIDVIVVGSPDAQSDANAQESPPRMVGPVLFLEPKNHLQWVAVVSFYARDRSRFADGSGLASADERAMLDTQIAVLERKIAALEADANASSRDREQSKSRLEDLKNRRSKLTMAITPSSGNFFRVQQVAIDESLGTSPQLDAVLTEHYRAINAENRERFKDRLPPPPMPNQPFFVGASVCQNCHSSAFGICSATKHKSAYETLVTEAREFDLNCVSCHVTGYEKPGGSTVTHADKPDLRGVQCEQCHGAGSQHVVDPVANAMKRQVPASVCMDCHRSPHVDRFDYATSLPLILGPGHGQSGAPVVVEPPADWHPPAAPASSSR